MENKEIIELENLRKEKKENEKGLIQYEVNGEKIELNFNLVRKTLVKGNSPVTNEEIIQFMSLCKYNKLNPFLNEAFLIKFGEKSEMIVSKEAFIKRAETSGNYDGFEAGIIVRRNNEILELEGSFKLEEDKLLGGWAKVYRKDQRFPIVSKVGFYEYIKITKYKNGIWEEGGKPLTMIRKVALTQALREAFPNQLGAMYEKDELNIDIDITTKKEKYKPKNKIEQVMEEKKEIIEVEILENEENEENENIGDLFDK